MTAGLHQGYFEGSCAVTDPEIAGQIAEEAARQRSAVELVASENFVSRAVTRCSRSFSISAIRSVFSL